MLQPNEEPLLKLRILAVTIRSRRTLENKRIIHELSARQKRNRLVVALDGDTALTGEQVRVEQAAKVSVVLTVRIGVWRAEPRSRVYDING